MSVACMWLNKVIHDGRGEKDENDVKMPLLVYLSREKRPSYPTHFKAGALNALVRTTQHIPLLYSLLFLFTKRVSLCHPSFINSRKKSTFLDWDKFS